MAYKSVVVKLSLTNNAILMKFDKHLTLNKVHRGSLELEEFKFTHEIV